MEEKRLTDAQLRMLKALEEAGFTNPESVRMLGEIVKGAAAWGYVKKWLIQTAAVIGAFGALWAAVEFFRKGGPQ